MFSEVAADWSFHIPAHHSHLLVSLHHRCQSPKKSQNKEEQLERCAAVKTRALLQAPALWPNWARLTTRRPLRPRKVEETSRSRDSGSVQPSGKPSLAPAPHTHSSFTSPTSGVGESWSRAVALFGIGVCFLATVFLVFSVFLTYFLAAEFLLKW